MDILTGSLLGQQSIDDNGSDADLVELSKVPTDWWQRVSSCLLY